MAITPKPGYQIDPNNPNGVIPISGSTPSQQPTGTRQVALGGQMVTIDASGNVVSGIPTGTDTSAASTDTSGTPPPAPQISSNLQPGSQGADVKQLQDYLVSMGYLTPEQVATGSGTYGPQTTAAVAKLQSDLGLQPTTGKGYYGPQTKSALAQKYQQLYQSKQGTQPPQTGAEASSALGSADTTTPSDPIFGSIASALEPIMNSLTQVVSNINNPSLTAVSLQQEYSQLQQQYGLPAMQSQMLNMQNVMNGTESDIRDEITKTGGFATESQIMGMTAARNNVILKQYNALSTQYQAAQTNVSNLMQYATQDQQTQFQREQLTASVTESMASIEGQMMQMGMTMQQHATDNLNKIVTNVGYTGLAAQAKDNPQQLAQYERLLGFNPGAFSNPDSLAKLETLRQQTVSLGQQKVNIQMYNAGLGGNPTGTNSNTPGLYVNNPQGGQSLVATNSQGNDSQGRPYSVTADGAKNLIKLGATIDPGTNNMIVPNIGYYVAQSDGSYKLSIDPLSSEGKYIQFRNMVDNPPPLDIPGGPTQQRMARNSYTRQTNAALKQYVESPTYKNVSGGVTYLARINAAMTNPGSVSDLELADSIVKLNNAGGQVTDAQLNSYLHGQSWGDKFAIIDGKATKKGGFLSPQQRADMKQQAEETFSNYRSQYQDLYVKAMTNLEAQKIPQAFWGNMPDFTSMLSTQ